MILLLIQLAYTRADGVMADVFEKSLFRGYLKRWSKQNFENATVTASSIYSERFPVENLYDGLTNTSWIAEYRGIYVLYKSH